MKKKILVTGGSGFVGTHIAIALKRQYPNAQVICLDNLKRRGSELNLSRLTQAGVDFIHGDVRVLTDLKSIGSVDCLIECLIDCPLKKLNLAGIKLDNYQVLENFRLESLTLSPNLMTNYDFDAVKSLDVSFIRGPGDPEDQPSGVFFKKYA